MSETSASYIRGYTKSETLTRYHKGAYQAVVVLWHQPLQGLSTVEKCDEGGARAERECQPGRFREGSAKSSDGRRACIRGPQNLSLSPCTMGVAVKMPCTDQYFQQR